MNLIVMIVTIFHLSMLQQQLIIYFFPLQLNQHESRVWNIFIIQQLFNHFFYLT